MKCGHVVGYTPSRAQARTVRNERERKILRRVPSTKTGVSHCVLHLLQHSLPTTKIQWNGSFDLMEWWKRYERGARLFAVECEEG